MAVVQNGYFIQQSSWSGILMSHFTPLIFIRAHLYNTLNINCSSDFRLNSEHKATCWPTMRLIMSCLYHRKFVCIIIVNYTRIQRQTVTPVSPERQLLHLVVSLISEDFKLLVELSDERLAVLQVAGQFPLTLHRLAALHPRHVLDTRAAGKRKNHGNCWRTCWKSDVLTRFSSIGQTT